MTLAEQIDQRLALAATIGRRPVRWIATEAAAVQAGVGDTLRGLPVTIGAPRSEWGLELVCEVAA